ncbi:DUF2846 domain-containing protein [bacterium]|nr:DUF2846 domain-containing protein [bacterium]
MNYIKTKLLIFAFLGFLFQGCGASYMIYPEVTPQLAPKPDKATLVIARDTSFGGGVAFANYLDRKFIGDTQGATYFITYVEPGEHIIAAVSENTVAAKVNFEAGKIYAYSQGVNMGVWRARVRDFFPLNRKEAQEAISYCTYWQYDPQYMVADLDQAYWQTIIDEHDSWVKDDPEGYKKLIEYKGF